MKFVSNTATRKLYLIKRLIKINQLDVNMSLKHPSVCPEKVWKKSSNLRTEEKPQTSETELNNHNICVKKHCVFKSLTVFINILSSDLLCSRGRTSPYS